MRRIIPILMAAMILLFVALPAYATGPYLGQNGYTYGGYPITYHSWVWWTSAVNGGRPSDLPDAAPLRWNFDAGSDQSKWNFPIASYINDALGNWMVPGGITISPPWMATLWVSDSTTAELRWNHTDDCVGVSCIKFLLLTSDSTSAGAYITSYRIHIISSVFNSETEANRRAAVTHELGHVFGLADRYDNGGCQNGETSIMESLGCHSIQVPQGVDLFRFQEFHKPTASMAAYNQQFIGNSFYAFIRDYAAQGVASLHQLQYWNGSQWKISPTNKMDWYKMGDNWSWNSSDSFSGKWVGMDASWGQTGYNYRLCSRPIIGFNFSWGLPPLNQVPTMTLGPWTCSAQAYRP